MRYLYIKGWLFVECIGQHHDSVHQARFQSHDPDKPASYSLVLAYEHFETYSYSNNTNIEALSSAVHLWESALTKLRDEDETTEKQNMERVKILRTLQKAYLFMGRRNSSISCLEDLVSNNACLAELEHAIDPWDSNCYRVVVSELIRLNLEEGNEERAKYWFVRATTEKFKGMKLAHWTNYLQVPPAFEPGLRAMSIWPSELLDVPRLLEANSQSILHDFQMFAANRTASTWRMAPSWVDSYLVHGSLSSWADLELYDGHGSWNNENCKFFPVACELLRGHLEIQGLPPALRQPAVMQGGVSVLRLEPGTRVSLHSGPYNGRLTMHFGLQIPGDCELEVAGAAHRWQEGRSLVFDDSFVHTVINRGREPRFILHATLWHPDIWKLEARAPAVKKALAHEATNPGVLSWAARIGFLDVLSWALPKVANRVSSEVPMYAAALGGHSKVMAWLLARRASDDHISDTDKAIHGAARVGHVKLLQWLLKRRSQLNAKDASGNRPLYLAAEAGHVQALSCLLQHRASIKSSSRQRKQPMHVAAENGHMDVVSYLIANRAAVSPVDEEKEQPLHSAARHNHVEVCKKLLDHAAAVSSENDAGHQPLHIAVEGGHVPIMTFLVQQGSESQAIGDAGEHHLHVAAEHGHGTALSWLLRHRANVDAKDDAGRQPLHVVAANGHSKALSFLVGKHAKVDATDVFGRQPLHYAASVGHILVMERLLQRRAQIDGKTKKFEQPLHVSISAGHVDVVQWLLQHSADFRARKVDGESPKSVAQKHGHSRILSLLKSWQRSSRADL